MSVEKQNDSESLDFVISDEETEEIMREVLDEHLHSMLY